MDVCEVEVSRERTWYSCVECKKGVQGFVIFALLVINLLEELYGIMFDGLRERSVIRAILYSVHDNGNLAMAFKGLRRIFQAFDI
jgi:hypothetical protein